MFRKIKGKIRPFGNLVPLNGTSVPMENDECLNWKGENIYHIHSWFCTPIRVPFKYEEVNKLLFKTELEWNINKKRWKKDRCNSRLVENSRYSMISDSSINGKKVHCCCSMSTINRLKCNLTWLCTGLSGFHICQAHMLDHRGANIKAIQEYPYYDDQRKTGLPWIVSSIIFRYLSN